MIEIEMGDHGSKSDIFWSVKEQRVDSSSISSYKDGVRCILVAGKPVFEIITLSIIFNIEGHFPIQLLIYVVLIKSIIKISISSKGLSSGNYKTRF